MVGMIQVLDSPLRISAPPHSQVVQPITLRVISLDRSEGRSILDDDRVPADESFQTNSAKLVYTGICSDIRSIRYLDMPRKRGTVRHYDLAAELTVMSHVGLGHEEVVVPDPCNTAAAQRAPVNGHKLTYRISLPDLSRRSLAGILQILGLQANGCEWKYPRLVSNCCPPVDNYMRLQTYAVAQDNVGADRRKGSDVNAYAKARGRRDDRRLMNER